MAILCIRFFNLLHRYNLTLDAVNISDTRPKLEDRLKKIIESIPNTDKNLYIEEITYLEVLYTDYDALVDKIKEFINNKFELMIESYLFIDGYDDGLKITDYKTLLSKKEDLLSYSHEATKKRGDDLDKIREACLNRLPDNIEMSDKASILAIIGNTYDLTESTIDDNIEDISNKIVEEIKNIRIENENTKDPENEWDLVNKNVEDLLKGEKDIEIRKCTYNGQVIEYDTLVRKLMTHMFPNYLTQVNILDTLDDEYTIETNKCRVIRSVGGSLRVEFVHEDD